MYVSKLKVEMSKFTEDMVILQGTWAQFSY